MIALPRGAEQTSNEPHASPATGDVLARAATGENKAALRAQTERAQALGTFGAPSLVVGEELYWGNDRLGDAVARAALG